MYRKVRFVFRFFVPVFRLFEYLFQLLFAFFRPVFTLIFHELKNQKKHVFPHYCFPEIASLWGCFKKYFSTHFGDLPDYEIENLTNFILYFSWYFLWSGAGIFQKLHSSTDPRKLVKRVFDK